MSYNKNTLTKSVNSFIEYTSASIFQVWFAHTVYNRVVSHSVFAFDLDFFPFFNRKNGTGSSYHIGTFETLTGTTRPNELMSWKTIRRLL